MKIIKIIDRDYFCIIPTIILDNTTALRGGFSIHLTWLCFIIVLWFDKKEEI